MTTRRSRVARLLPVAAAFALAGLATSAAHAANIALGRAVVPSGPTWPGLNGFHLTDNDLATISHASGRYVQIEKMDVLRLQWSPCT